MQNPKKTKRIIISVIGSTVIILGIALLALPGPGILIILVGLAILATEFYWAKRLLKKIKQKTGLKERHINKFKKKFNIIPKLFFH